MYQNKIECRNLHKETINITVLKLKLLYENGHYKTSNMISQHVGKHLLHRTDTTH